LLSAQVKLDPRFVRGDTPYFSSRQLMLRLLNNLRQIYLTLNMAEEALGIIRWVLWCKNHCISVVLLGGGGSAGCTGRCQVCCGVEPLLQSACVHVQQVLCRIGQLVRCACSASVFALPQPGAAGWVI
jgi:hypothetical protein